MQCCTSSDHERAWRICEITVHGYPYGFRHTYIYVFIVSYFLVSCSVSLSYLLCFAIIVFSLTKCPSMLFSSLLFFPRRLSYRICSLVSSILFWFFYSLLCSSPRFYYLFCSHLIVFSLLPILVSSVSFLFSSLLFSFCFCCSPSSHLIVFLSYLVCSPLLFSLLSYSIFFASHCGLGGLCGAGGMRGKWWHACMHAMHAGMGACMHGCMDAYAWGTYHLGMGGGEPNAWDTYIYIYVYIYIYRVALAMLCDIYIYIYIHTYVSYHLLVFTTSNWHAMACRG